MVLNETIKSAKSAQSETYIPICIFSRIKRLPIRIQKKGAVKTAPFDGLRKNPRTSFRMKLRSDEAIL